MIKFSLHRQSFDYIVSWFPLLVLLLSAIRYEINTLHWGGKFMRPNASILVCSLPCKNRIISLNNFAWSKPLASLWCRIFSLAPIAMLNFYCHVWFGSNYMFITFLRCTPCETIDALFNRFYRLTFANWFMIRNVLCRMLALHLVHDAYLRYERYRSVQFLKLATAGNFKT